MMTIDEVRESHARPDEQDRPVFLCYEEGCQYVTEFEGVQYRAGNPFGLASQLSEAGAPQRCTLYLVEGRLGDHSREEF